MALEPRYQRDPDAIGLRYTHSSNGNLVPLREVAKLKRSVVPLTAGRPYAAAIAAMTLAPIILILRERTRVLRRRDAALSRAIVKASLAA